jgi:hypothetical protein
MAALVEGRARTVLAVIVVVAVLAVPLVALFAFGGGDGGDDAEATEPALRLEASATLPELIVFVDPQANEPGSAGGARSVTLRCEDANGQLIAAQDEAWPFGDTDSGTLDPHAHVSLDQELIEQVDTCRLVGTKPALVGSMP